METIGPTRARLQLRMRPDLVHVVHARIADLRVVQTIDDLLRSEARECFGDDLAQGLWAARRAKPQMVARPSGPATRRVGTTPAAQRWRPLSPADSRVPVRPLTWREASRPAKLPAFR